ncbi:unnamed protein product, partial [Polarella glacialis]
LQRMLTVQQVYRREPPNVIYTGPHFWHSAGFGNFKNGLDVSFFVAGAYAEHFHPDCKGECGLTQAFTSMLNWLITLKQFSIFPMADQLAPFVPLLEEMGSPQVQAMWRHAPWHLLFVRPAWADAFRMVIQELEDFVAADGAFSRDGSQEDDDYFRRTAARMGAAIDSE